MGTLHVTRCYIRNHHLGESLSCSLFTDLGWLYEEDWSGNSAIWGVWPDYHH